MRYKLGAVFKVFPEKNPFLLRRRIKHNLMQPNSSSTRGEHYLTSSHTSEPHYGHGNSTHALATSKKWAVGDNNYSYSAVFRGPSRC